MTAEQMTTELHELIDGYLRQQSFSPAIDWNLSVEHGIHGRDGGKGWVENRYNDSATITVKINGGAQDTGLQPEPGANDD